MVHPVAVPGRRLPVIDILRGLTILWVTALHFYVDARAVPGPDLASATAAWQALRAGDLVECLAVAVRSLVGLPGFRLDLLLFVTALVAMQSRPVPAPAFYARRLRAILPQYWLGTLAVLGVCVACAWLRAAVGRWPFSTELHQGALLAGDTYTFVWPDVLRSLSLVGRLEDARTMQVVAPSLWYIVLVAHLYLVFPWLRRVHAATGSVGLLAVSAIVTFGGRAWVFATEPLAGFDANATVICFLPFRMIAPAFGMVVAGWMSDAVAGHSRVRIARVSAAGVSCGAALLLLVAMWLGSGMNDPGTVAGLLGPVPPLAVALPALWWLALRALDHPRVSVLLRWAGTHSLSILVTQDALRFAVGSARSLGVDVAPWTFVLLPGYLGVAMALARAWHPWPEAAASTVTRWWRDRDGRACSPAGPGSVPPEGDVCISAAGAPHGTTVFGVSNEPDHAGQRMTPGDLVVPARHSSDFCGSQ